MVSLKSLALLALYGTAYAFPLDAKPTTELNGPSGKDVQLVDTSLDIKSSSSSLSDQSEHHPHLEARISKRRIYNLICIVTKGLSYTLPIAITSTGVTSARPVILSAKTEETNQKENREVWLEVRDDDSNFSGLALVLVNQENAIIGVKEYLLLYQGKRVREVKLDNLARPKGDL